MKSAAITVLGAGSYGTALAICLARNGHDTLLWGRNKDDMHAMATQAQAIDQARQGMGDAVDFRREGFADQSDVQKLCIHASSLGCRHECRMSGV